MILDSKILVNLTLAVPSCLIAAALCIVALGYRGMESVWIFAVLLTYCFFEAVLGTDVNLKFPDFHWDNEAAVVKQGTAILVGMLFEFLSVLLGIVLVFLLRIMSYHLLMGGIMAILIAAAMWIYKKIVKFDLRKLE